MRNFVPIITLLIFLSFSCKHRNERLNSTVDNTKQIIPIDTSFNKIKEPIDSSFLSDSNSVFLSCETWPVFPGGERALIDYINNNTVYPQSAINDKIEGRVVLRFVIRKDGQISNIEIIKSIRNDLDKECIKVIQRMPKWEPGKIQDKLISVYYVIPFRFSLLKDNRSKGIQITPRPTTAYNKINATIYPNPAKDFVVIKLDTVPVECDYKIISFNGQAVKTGSIDKNENRIDLHDLQDGTYIVSLISFHSKQVSSYKIIIKK